MTRRGHVLFNDVLAGEIRETDEGYEFVYCSAWLQRTDTQPVSLTLPLQEKPFTSRTMIPFFDGLIPEGWLLSIARNTWKLDAGDRMGLLLSVCRDPVGAVSIRPAEEGPE